MFVLNKGRFNGWRVLDTQVYHSEKTGQDYHNAIFLDSEGYRKLCRIADGVDVALIERAKDTTQDVCISAFANKDYSFLVFEGFYPAEV